MKKVDELDEKVRKSLRDGSWDIPELSDKELKKVNPRYKPKIR